MLWLDAGGPYSINLRVYRIGIDTLNETKLHATRFHVRANKDSAETSLRSFARLPFSGTIALTIPRVVFCELLFCFSGMVFLTENWFWRGTQSAAWYYFLSCQPCLERKHNRKRRREAAKAKEEKGNSTIYTQPGVIRQPDPFETNEEWAQEIVQGPGPPKGWKRDSIYFKYARKFQRGDVKDTQLRPRGITVDSTDSPAKSVFTGITDASTAVESAQGLQVAQSRADASAKNTNQLLRHNTENENQTSKVTSSNQSSTNDAEKGDTRDLQTSSSRETGTTGSKRSSFESVSTAERRTSVPRPSMEKRLSTGIFTAYDGFKETMRAALHPEHWNWIRYDRDDEVLSNINERMRGVWDNVKGHVTFPPEETTLKLPQSPTEAASTENKVKKWQRGTHPAVNDLSPPIVSQLPYTKEEAQWMLLPPASADVMLGRARPDLFDDINRKPLCIVGRPAPETHANPAQELPAASSDDDETGSSGSESDSVWTAHLQKPQRAHLYKRRASYGFEIPSN